MKKTLTLLAKSHRLALCWMAVLVLDGCSSTKQTTAKGEHALVCPHCKTVAVPDTSYARVPNPNRVVYHHTCPGCRSVMDTFFKEGKWEHKCSFCKDKPYTCPVFHPTST